MKYFIIVLTYSVFGFTYGTDCPDLWLAFQGSCYRFGFGKHMTFYTAEAYCKQHHGAHLIHIEDARENAVVKEFLKHFIAENWWIGLTDEDVEGYWQWYDTNTPVTFTNWHPGQLDDKGGEDCSVFSRSFNYDWADVSCTKLYEPICELKPGNIEIVG